ncbi:MAG: hypothetical protein D4R64_18570 [Porphyromonadaceae bacterium]|nr:MAG: hypothetical protein D4R64_18570 [Porphyromonadaceae bacterium]
MALYFTFIFFNSQFTDKFYLSIFVYKIGWTNTVPNKKTCFKLHNINKLKKCVMRKSIVEDVE